MPSVNNGLSDSGQESITWEYHSVTLHRVPGYGFGIAVSGGRDNPHFANGDPAIAISDVLKGGPADNKLLLNDRILSANGISLENVDYATAIQVLRDNSVVQLVIKRRVVLHSSAISEYDTLQFTINRSASSTNTNSSKKYTLEDYGVHIAAQLVVTTKHRNLQVGDVITSINNNSIENKSIQELKKIMEKSNLSKLDLVIKRKKHLPTGQNASFYTNENLYVQPPRRANGYTNPNNPLLDMEPPLPVPIMDRFDAIPPPRPPLPVEVSEELGNSGTLVPNGGNSDYNFLANATTGDYTPGGTRTISFHKKGSVGIRLAGGNAVGIFVTAVQPNSPASMHLQPGDCILSVNNMDLTNYTREEAVNLLMSLNNQVSLKIITKLDEYNNIIENNTGDSFYIRTHFDYSNPASSMSNELDFKNGDIFHVTDTLFNGAVGFWEVVNVNTNEKGIILNKKSAKAFAATSTLKNNSGSESKTLFFMKRRKKSTLADEQFFDCYEKVVFKHPNFKRPIIFFGAIADIARERLARDFNHEFIMPALDSATKAIKLTQIRGIIDQGKHGLLDVNPASVNKLNYVGIYPIIILLKIDNKLLIKNIRANNKINETRGTDTAKKSHSTRQLYEETLKFEKNWSHLVTATLNITNGDTWFRELKELIENEQRKHIWMSDEMSNRSPNDSAEQQQFEVNANIEDYSFASHQHYDTLPRTANPVSIEEFDRSLTLNQNQINKLHSDEILLPDYNEPPPYAITTNASSTTALFTEPLPPLPHLEDPRATTGRIDGKKEKKHRDTYNGHSHSRMSSKLNYIPVLAHSPIVSPRSPFPEGPPKPPKVDRTKKPRSATERLFGENNPIRSSVTPERNGGNGNGMMKSMSQTHQDNNNGQEEESFYDNHHFNAYRYTRPPPPNFTGFESPSKPSRVGQYGQIYPSSTDSGPREGNNNKHESPYTIFNAKTLEEMKPGFKGKSNGQSKEQQRYEGEGIYNGVETDAPPTNGRSPYSHHAVAEPNDNPYRSVQPTHKSRLAGMKPVPPPKPAKPIRSDLYTTSTSSSSNGFYLNVPITLGNREQSAFELYRKAKREGSNTSTPA